MQVLSSIIADLNCVLDGKKFKFLGGDMSQISKCGVLIPNTLETWYMILRWLPPRLGLKGNVDGSSSLSSSGGGGIAHNNGGTVIFAFSNNYCNTWEFISL